MPKSAVKTGFGSKFYLTDTPANIMQAASQWAEVIGMKPPTDSWDTAETTHFESDGQTREFIKTLLDGGEADIQINFIPGSATHLAIRTAIGSPNHHTYAFLIPKVTSGWWKVQGECLVVGFDPEVPLEDRMVATIRLKFTGPRTEAAAV